MSRLLAYRGTRYFAVWVALDLSLTLVLLASVGPEYLDWRSEHPWTVLLTVPPLAWLAWKARR